MSRELVSLELLCDYINAELRKHAGCENCTVGVIMPLANAILDECNRSMPPLTSSGAAVFDGQKAYSEVIRVARRKYNLKNLRTDRS